MSAGIDITLLLMFPETIRIFFKNHCNARVCQFITGDKSNYPTKFLLRFAKYWDTSLLYFTMVCSVIWQPAETKPFYV